MSENIDILVEHNFWDEPPSDLGLRREDCLRQLEEGLGNRLVKVLIGQRRAGKSTVLRQVIQCLLQRGVTPANVFYFDKECIDFADVTGFRQLHELIQAYRRELSVSGKVYLLLDEVQEVAEWERLATSYAQDKTAEYELFITGSNSTMLSSELATLLSGRHLPVEVLPFSFAEYAAVRGMEADKEACLDYLASGGLPELTELRATETRRHYVMALRDSILLSDIVRRHSVRDVALLESLFQFACDSMGSLFSVNKLVNHMCSRGSKTNHETVANYMGYLCQALLVHECQRYDVRGKQILTGPRKYYLNDLAFRQYLSSGFDPGMTRRLENAVYLHLRRQGYEVFVGTVAGSEVDFVAERGGERLYYQVCYRLADEAVVEREYRPLERIGDNYPKAVVSMDDVNFGQRSGIAHLLAWEFLRE